jgi:hypothetical protein
MSPENPMIAPPSIDEIIEAAQPGASADLRKSILQRLRSADDIADEAVAGARDFLDDHGHDFEALHAFLQPFDIIEKPRSDQSIWRRLAPTMAAASILLMLTVSGWWYFLRTDKKEIVNTLLFHEPGLPVFASLNGDRDFHEMMSDFRLGDVIAGLSHFHSLKAKYPDSDTLAYFGGWFHYMLADYDSAAYEFSSLSGDASIYQQKAELMRAASLVLGNRLEESRSLLDSIISDPGHPFRKSALDMKDHRVLWKRPLF